MNFLSRSVFALGVVAVGAFFSSASGAQPQRLTSVDLDGQERVRFANSVRPVFADAQDEGRLAPSLVLHGVIMHFKRSAEQEAEFQRLLVEQQTPGSPNFHKWLTPQEYATRFGVDSQDLDKVSQWLRAHGLQVEAISPTRDSVTFSGSVAKLEQTFGTEMHNFTLGNGEVHFSNKTDVLLPASLSEMVLAVRHLDDVHPKPRLTKKPSQHFTSNITGKTFAAPDDFATIFGVKALYAAGFDGSGRTIAIVGRTPIVQSNVDAFRSAAGLGQATVNQVLVPNTGASTISDPDLEEAYLDVEWSGGVAKNARINFYYVGNSQNSDVFDALMYAIDNNVAPVISISYGNCEVNIGTTNTNALRAEVQKGVGMGQTVLAASGDNGAADCDDAGVKSAVKGYGVDVPASIPEVTGVGGTEFIADVNASSKFWNSGNNSSNGSARGYIGEGAWNDTANAGSLNASGGGKSTLYKHSTDSPWQSAPGMPTDDVRFVPDVSLPASPLQDGYLICAQTQTVTPCVNGFRESNQGLTVVGGTSVSAPAFAGILTILEQAIGNASGSGEGNINKNLYPIAQNAAAYASAFHDTTSGDNIVPCTIGQGGCTTGSIGFTTNAGYDLVTGLGSPDAFNLEEAYASIIKSNGKALTTTTVSGNTSGAQPGQSITFTANVAASGSAGSVGSGNVRFMVDGDYSGSPVAVTAGQATFTMAFPVGGYHTVSATYFGAAGLGGSDSAPLSFLVGSSGNANFSVSASPASLTLANTGGASTTSVILVQGNNQFSGTITLSCSVAFAGTTTAGTLPTCSLSNTSISLSPSAVTGNSTLTVAIPAVTGALRHNGLWTLGSTAMLGCVFLFGGSTRRRVAAAGSLLMIVGFAVGCGGVKASPASATSGGVKSGPYNVIVTATPSAGTPITTMLNLTVQ
ncbi:MAG: Ig-like domain repeat protein [Acidobacteriales bacterium]|nr:Ig-like domain repeat protein [Terriglobales bacterium]